MVICKGLSCISVASPGFPLIKGDGRGTNKIKLVTSNTHYSLLITHYSLLITHYSLLITHYSLLRTSS
ncbi:MAG: hypothetical protein F6K47_00225 [Symploca sp. SIO2E6]|nr:hypothetical protein [Symploca sp. SIO2E6]